MPESLEAKTLSQVAAFGASRPPTRITRGQSNPGASERHESVELGRLAGVSRSVSYPTPGLLAVDSARFPGLIVASDPKLKLAKFLRLSRLTVFWRLRMISWFDSLSLAAASPQTVQDPRAGTLQLVMMMVLMIVMFYFALWRPQQKKQKQHAALLEALKPGDKVVTNSGICGVVISIKDRSVSLRSADSKLEILKDAIANILDKQGGDGRKS